MFRNLGFVSALIALAVAAEGHTDEHEQNGSLAKASALMGRNVINTQNESLGELYDPVVDQDGKRISHLVLAEGGVLGIGATLRPVPTEAAKLKRVSTVEVTSPAPAPPAPTAARRPGREAWVLEVDVTQERFQEAPTLEDDWSVVEDPEWAAKLDAFYGLEDLERHEEQQTYRGSQLTGTRVRDRTRLRDLGNLREIVFEIGTGQIRYGALADGGFLGFDETLVAVPWEAFTVQEIDGWTEFNLVLDASEEQIDGAAGFDHNNWPRVADPGLAEELGTQ
jgi:sporulation protein YlmC with PRC-barrel domain